MDELIAALSRYMALSAAEVEHIRRVARPTAYPRNHHLFEPPAICRELFFMMSGLVRSYYLFQDREVNLRLLCDDSAVLPLSSYITQTPTFEYIQCLSDARGYLVPLPISVDPAAPPEALENLRRVVAERHYLAMQRRLLTLQYKSVAERYQYFQETMEAKIVSDTPALHVASYLGVRPESLSRIRRST